MNLPDDDFEWEKEKPVPILKKKKISKLLFHPSNVPIERKMLLDIIGEFTFYTKPT